MRILRILLVVVSSVLTAFPSLPTAAEESPVLGVLEYSGGLLPKKAEIHASHGVTRSPYPDLTQRGWVLHSGDVLKQEFAPHQRLIQFLKLNGNTPERVCSILVRYTRTEKGWVPTYLLLQQPPVVWNGEQLIPSTSTGGSRTPLLVVNNNDPNVGGYYRELSFRLASGSSRIDGWTIQ